MRNRAMLAGAALLALAGCDNTGAGGNNSADANVAITVENSANTAAPANTAEVAPPPAGNTVASTGPAPTRDYIVGRWTDTGNCADAITFQADGVLLGPGGGGQPERWDLQGDQLTMVGNPMALTVAVVDQNTMDTTNTQGRTRRVTRC